MTTNTRTEIGTQVDAGYETSTFALGTGLAAAAMVGIWAIICMASTLLETGLGGVVRGLLAAITGS